MTEHDELREFAQALVPDADLVLSRGEGALQLAFAQIATDTIGDVYADCGDNDPAVLGSNVGTQIARAVASQLQTFRRPRVIKTADELDKLPVGAVVLDSDASPEGRTAWTLEEDEAGRWWRNGELGLNANSLHLFGPVTVLWEGGE